MDNPDGVNITMVVQVIVVLLTGLLAGLLYGYDCSVIKGLGNLSDQMYLQAFQSINKAIQNPYFFVSFMGSLISLPVATFLTYRLHNIASFYLLLTATLVFIIGVFGVTAFGNIPLNNMLDRFDLSTASGQSVAAMRKKFEAGWNLLHHIRTYAGIITFLLAILSLVKRS